MAKFKNGDKVRITAVTPWSDGAPQKGNIGVVTGCETTSYATRIVARFDECERPCNDIGNDGWIFREEWLELVSEASTTEFKPGDRVRVRALYVDSPPLRDGTVEDCDGHLRVRYDDSGTWDWIGEGSTEVVEVLSSPDAPIAPATPTRREPVAKRRPYAAPRNTTIEEAKVGDDRPAPNGEEFEATMLAHFDEDDAKTFAETAKRLTRRITSVGADVAIDLALFAARIKRRLSEPAA